MQAALPRETEPPVELLSDHRHEPLRGRGGAGGDRDVQQVRPFHHLGVDGVDRLEPVDSADGQIRPVGPRSVRQHDLLEGDVQAELLQRANVELLLAPEAEAFEGRSRGAVALHLRLDLADARRVAERRAVVEEVARDAAEPLEPRRGHVAGRLARRVRVGVDAGIRRQREGVSHLAERRLRQRQQRELELRRAGGGPGRQENGGDERRDERTPPHHAADPSSRARPRRSGSRRPARRS